MTWNPFASVSVHEARVQGAWSPFSATVIESYVFVKGQDPHEAEVASIARYELARKKDGFFHSGTINAGLGDFDLVLWMVVGLALSWYRSDEGAYAFSTGPGKSGKIPYHYVLDAIAFAENLLKSLPAGTNYQLAAASLMGMPWDQIPFGLVDWSWFGRIGRTFPSTFWKALAAEFPTPIASNLPPKYTAMNVALSSNIPTPTVPGGVNLGPSQSGWPDVPWTMTSFNDIPWKSMPWTASAPDPFRAGYVSLLTNADGSEVTTPEQFARNARILLTTCAPSQPRNPITGRCGEPVQSNFPEPGQGSGGGLGGWLDDYLNQNPNFDPTKPPPLPPPPEPVIDPGTGGGQDTSPGTPCTTASGKPGHHDSGAQCVEGKPGDPCPFAGGAGGSAGGRLNATYDCVQADQGGSVGGGGGTGTGADCAAPNRVWIATGECIGPAEQERRAKLNFDCGDRGGIFDATDLSCRYPDTTSAEDGGEETKSMWPWVIGLGVVGVAVALVYGATNAKPEPVAGEALGEGEEVY